MCTCVIVNTSHAPIIVLQMCFQTAYGLDMTGCSCSTILGMPACSSCVVPCRGMLDAVGQHNKSVATTAVQVVLTRLSVINMFVHHTWAVCVCVCAHARVCVYVRMYRCFALFSPSLALSSQRLALLSLSLGLFSQSLVLFSHMYLDTCSS